ncbi:segregation/condensation protein A [Patescibacteria group bacterium]|nr:segregation/condensation protein A [Patescibacteria group bacterium]MBU1890942.1 segregation/condensation protein A [Patescibacteria group bacterium]
MYKIRLEQFEGPLDLLLKMIEEEKLDITTVSLARVTDQFLAYLEQLEEIRAEELADFLVVAAKLLLIKSKSLLPIYEPEEEEVDLEKQLKIYKEYLEASKKVQQIIKKKKYTYIREVKQSFLEPIFCPPPNLDASGLKNIMLEVLRKLEPLVTLPETVIERAISIQEKINQIKNLIGTDSKLNFKSLMKNAETRTEIIVTFLALLELIKQENVLVVQESIFEDITINNYQKNVIEE